MHKNVSITFPLDKRKYTKLLNEWMKNSIFDDDEANEMKNNILIS